jgi:hypothetical protein
MPIVRGGGIRPTAIGYGALAASNGGAANGPVAAMAFPPPSLAPQRLCWRFARRSFAIALARLLRLQSWRRGLGVKILLRRFFLSSVVRRVGPASGRPPAPKKNGPSAGANACVGM